MYDDEQYKIIDVKGHYEVYLKQTGEFICSADTRSEAEEEIREMN